MKTASARWAGWSRVAGTVLLAGLAGCDPSPNTTLLSAPGGRGVISGTVDFEGGGGPPYPVAEVLAFENADPNCTSAFTTMALMGTMNGFDIAQAPQYLMTEVAPCLWIRELELEKGGLDLKFATDSDYDAHPDYGKNGANTFLDALEGTLDSPAPGPDGNLSVNIPEAGTWTFILNETTSPATYRITRESLIIRTTPQDPSFRISSLPVGTYDVSITSPGYFARRLTGVTVAHNVVNELGRVAIEYIAGAVRGRVRYADAPATPPRATVTLKAAGTAQTLQTAQSESTFAFTGLMTGTYDVDVDARGYRDTTLAGVVYTNGTDTDLGDIVLQSETVLAVEVDGSADALYGNALAVQTVQTGFGDANQGQVDRANGSELDQVFGTIRGGVLYLLFAGNLESNNNKIDIFLDTKVGGQDTLRADNPNIDFDGLNRMSGLLFDVGFEPDYYLSMSGSVSGTYKTFANWAEVLTAGGGIGRFLGEGTAVSDGTLAGAGADNPDGIRVTINNSNAAGVGGGSAAASGAGVLTGIEWAIPLEAIGNPGGCVRVTAWINGINHDFLANQVLAPLAPPAPNLGDPHAVNFRAPALSGDQFFTVCPGN